MLRVKKAYIAPFEEQRRLAHEARLALEQKMEEVKPKVVFAESIEVAKTSISVGEMAKLIKQATGYDIGQNRFFEWLRSRGYLHKDGSQTNMPTQRSMDAGWMEIKEGTRIGSSGESRITRTPKITGKGQIYFINLFKKMSVVENVMVGMHPHMKQGYFASAFKTVAEQWNHDHPLPPPYPVTCRGRGVPHGGRAQESRRAISAFAALQEA